MATIRAILWMPVMGGLVSTMVALAANAESPAAPVAIGIKERQDWMRRITQQQQSVLQQRFNCINRATNLAELEACERGYPVLGPSWRHGPGMGGWTCPMW